VSASSAGVLGIGAIVRGIPAQNATVNVKLEQMQQDIATLKSGVGDHYTVPTRAGTGNNTTGASEVWNDV